MSFAGAEDLDPNRTSKKKWFGGDLDNEGFFDVNTMQNFKPVKVSCNCKNCGAPKMNSVCDYCKTSDGQRTTFYAPYIPLRTNSRGPS